MEIPFLADSGSGVLRASLDLEALRDLLDLFDGVALGGLEMPEVGLVGVLAGELGDVGPFRSWKLEEGFIKKISLWHDSLLPLTTFTAHCLISNSLRGLTFI